MAPDAQPSAVRIGGYDVFAKLGGGGMGEIYLGRQTGLGNFVRPVVLKVIREHLADDEQYRRMFLDEARITAMIAHPNVVHVLDFGEHEDLLYIAMEYLDGESLATMMRRQAERGVRMSPPLIAHILAEACAGLHAAHNVTTADGRPLHLVHRDVSPSNIFVTFDGTVKLLDFGVARAEERIAESRAGRFGKMAYMSPEQVTGAVNVDRRSDIFGLGIVLFELCTLRRLFRRPTQPEIVDAIVKGPIPLLSEVMDSVPLQLDLICQKCLARRPDDRYGSAVELRRDLLGLRQVLAPADQVPEEAVAAFMQSLFKDRRTVKARMQSNLHRLPTGAVWMGSSASPIPSPEPDAEHPATIPTPDIRAPEPGSGDSWFLRSGAVSSAAIFMPDRRPLVLALLLVVSLVLGVGLWWRNASSPQPRILAPAPVESRVFDGQAVGSDVEPDASADKGVGSSAPTDQASGRPSEGAVATPTVTGAEERSKGNPPGPSDERIGGTPRADKRAGPRGRSGARERQGTSERPRPSAIVPAAEPKKARRRKHRPAPSSPPPKSTPPASAKPSPSPTSPPAKKPDADERQPSRYRRFK